MEMLRQNAGLIAAALALVALVWLLVRDALSRREQKKLAARLATIENADQILVIDGGTVAQRGTHKELLQQEGTYKKFIQIREQAEGWRIQ